MQNLRLTEGFELADVPVDVPADELDPRKAGRKARRLRNLEAKSRTPRSKAEAAKAEAEEQFMQEFDADRDFELWSLERNDPAGYAKKVDQILKGDISVVNTTCDDPEDRAGFEAALSREYPHRILAKRLAKGDKVLTRIYELHLRHTRGAKLHPKIKIVDGKIVKFYETHNHKGGTEVKAYGVDDEGNIYYYNYSGWASDAWFQEQIYLQDPEYVKYMGYSEKERRKLLDEPEPEPLSITKITFEELPQL